MPMKKSTLWTIVIVVILVVSTIILISIPKQKEPEAVVPETEEVVEKETKDVLKQAKEVVPGGSLVTKQGEIVTETGEIVSSEALPGSPTAPKQSRVLQESEVPKGAVKLTMSSFGINPDEFTVKQGGAVTLSVTSGDSRHIFAFEDPELAGITIDIARNQTRALTFKAPAKKGNYPFSCSMVGHEQETGIMRVE